MKSTRQTVPFAPMLLSALAVLTGDLGFSAATKSDFNGDGWGDLAVGVPQEGFNGKVRAGAVHIIYGTSNGLSSSGNQFLTENTNDGTNCPGVAADDDNFGFALATGDFDNDGYGDLAASAPYLGGEPGGEGVVHVFYGSAGGVTCSHSQSWTQTGLADGVGNWGKVFGATLISGDFNQDSYFDLAIAAPTDGSGSVTVLYGGTRGLKASDAQRWTLSSPGIVHSPIPDYFGLTLAAGEFGHGAATDLAISMFWMKPSFLQTPSGAVIVIYGSTHGLRAEGSQFWTRDTPGIPGIAKEGDRFGEHLAAGNFGKSAQDDLAIWASADGIVHILYGSPGGLTIAGNQVWRTGFSGGMVAADFGRTTHADLVVGSGVFFGTRNGLTATDRQSLNIPIGTILTAANYGMDKRFDLATAGFHENVGGISHAGVVRIIYGSPQGLFVGNVVQLWTQNSPGIPDQAEQEDLFGRGLSK